MPRLRKLQKQKQTFALNAYDARHLKQFEPSAKTFSTNIIRHYRINLMNFEVCFYLTCIGFIWLMFSLLLLPLLTGNCSTIALNLTLVLSSLVRLYQLHQSTYMCVSMPKDDQSISSSLWVINVENVRIPLLPPTWRLVTSCNHHNSAQLQPVCWNWMQPFKDIFFGLLCLYW